MNPRTPLQNQNNALPNDSPALPTFLDHLLELRGRLFWIAAIFIGASAAAYPFADAIISFLTKPLAGQELVYLTPVGGFSFLIKVSTYVGLLAALPAIVYHLYGYIQPALGKINRKTLFGYAAFSVVLALLGVSFAYLVSLPAALHFLTGFDIKQVTAMLTVDAYLSFVIVYLLGSAILFQLPLLLLIINSVTPLTPKKLMGYQRHAILGAFVAAAIISPTPDMTNQALLALPIVFMYQLGIFLIWLVNMKKQEVHIEEVSLYDKELEAGTTTEDLEWQELMLEVNRVAPLRSIGAVKSVQSLTLKSQKRPSILKPQSSVAFTPISEIKPVAPIKKSVYGVMSDVHPAPRPRKAVHQTVMEKNAQPKPEIRLAPRSAQPVRVPRRVM